MAEHAHQPVPAVVVADGLAAFEQLESLGGVALALRGVHQDLVGLDHALVHRDVVDQRQQRGEQLHGLLPAALSHSIGSEVQRPLATVVVGGMLIGPLFLLLVMPAIRLTVLGKFQPRKRREGLGGKRV